MKVSVRLYNEGEVPIQIRAIEVTEINVVVPRPGPQGSIVRSAGGMHANGDHGASRLGAGEAGAWSFSLAFPCAPFLQLTLVTTVLNEATGSTEVITFVSGIEAYQGCPQGWERDW